MTDQLTFVPRTLGPYRIERALGFGAMGAVFQSVHSGLDRAVAVKILRPELVHDPDAIRRFLREARSVARLDHPNIVSVYDAGEYDGIPYMAMKLVEGESLQAILARTGPQPLERVLRIAGQLACALGYAHTRGLVHLDVKPANVLVETGDRVTLTDFGVAQALQPDSTQSTMITGTPLYMSPEQIRGEALDCRSDLYSLGLVMYEMCVGQSPFQGRFVSVMHAHLYLPVPDIKAIIPDVPDALLAVINRALAKDPAERFQTAGELHRALERVAAADISPDGRTQVLVPALVFAGGETDPSLTAQPETGSRTATINLRRDVSSAPPETAAGTTAGAGGHSRRSLTGRWAAGAVCALVLLVTMAAATVLLHRTGAEPARTKAASAMALSTVGAQYRHLYVSGRVVTLRWSPASHAAVYRLQVVAMPTNPGDPLDFRHPFRSELVEGTSKAMHVVGYQVYSWRVQANEDGRWGAYTPANRFTVARPVVGRPMPQLPRSGTSRRASRMMLCWSRVEGAVAYQLRVTGLQPRMVRNTCLWLPVRAQTYTWSVAAFVRGVRLYTGPQSPRWRFTIERQPAPTPRPTEAPSPTPTSQSGHLSSSFGRPSRSSGSGQPGTPIAPAGSVSGRVTSSGASHGTQRIPAAHGESIRGPQRDRRRRAAGATSGGTQKNAQPEALPTAVPAGGAGSTTARPTSTPLSRPGSRPGHAGPQTRCDPEVQAC